MWYGLPDLGAYERHDIINVEGRSGPANRGKLCVKGRFGMDNVMSPERLTNPMLRRDGAPKHAGAHLTVANIHEVFREVTWEKAMTRAAKGFSKTLTEKVVQRFAVLALPKVVTRRRTCSKS